MKRFASVCVVLVVSGLAVNAAQASTITTYASDTGSFAVSGTDQPGTGATVTSDASWTGSAANLNTRGTATNETTGGDGSYERGPGADFGISPGNWVTYTFDLTNATHGWDISEITSFASWSDNPSGDQFEDPGRSRQGYSVTATLVDNTTVSVLGVQTYVDGTDHIATKVDITGLALTGVKSLTFSDFVASPSPMGGGNVYHEIDVFGTATATPEPGAIVLLGTGLLGLLAYAWRKRR